jgi:hypothetical protein
MVKIQTIICSALVLLGIADLLTTVVGINAKGAVEANPLFASLTQTNILTFVGIKILTIAITGFLFIGSTRIAQAQNSNFLGRYFMTSASIASCFVMTAVVGNNLLILLKAA